MAEQDDKQGRAAEWVATRTDEDWAFILMHRTGVRADLGLAELVATAKARAERAQALYDEAVALSGEVDAWVGQAS